MRGVAVTQSNTPKVDRLNTTGGSVRGPSGYSQTKFVKPNNSTMNITGPNAQPTMGGTSYRNFLGMTGTGVFSRKMNYKAAEECPYNTSTAK